MSSLADLLKVEIAEKGPIRLEAYMSRCLGDPDHGYYMSGDPLGKEGDFVTAPEVSQMFGELLGLWAATVWQQMGEPGSFNLVELGPGRGTLMADFLRAAGGMLGFIEAADIHMVEMSPMLAKRQRLVFTTMDHSPTWHERLASVPAGPSLIIANEFFDALPIRQLGKTPAGWRDRAVGLDADGGFVWTALAEEVAAPAGFADAPVGSLLEINETAEAVMREMAERLSADGGAVLAIDYGYTETALGDTFQAVRDHDYADPLESPGDADLTAHVNFQRLAEVAAESGVSVSGPVTQSLFLRRLGIEVRAEQLMQTESRRQKYEIHTGLHRLIDDDQMGNLFKVLAVHDPSLMTLEGFGPDDG